MLRSLFLFSIGLHPVAGEISYGKLQTDAERGGENSPHPRGDERHGGAQGRQTPRHRVFHLPDDQISR